MRLSDISLLGWIHTVACVVAMVTGTRQLVGRKGTAAHALSGSIYLVSMLVANITVLSIFHREDVILRHGQPPVLGHGFGFFHWLAVITLARVLVGRLAASRQRQAFFAYAHPICMILSYWLLVGGAVDEAFDRVEWVRQAALAISPEARSLAGYKLLYIVYFAMDAVILTLLGLAVVQVRRFRRRPA